MHQVKRSLLCSNVDQVRVLLVRLRSFHFQRRQKAGKRRGRRMVSAGTRELKMETRFEAPFLQSKRRNQSQILCASETKSLPTACLTVKIGEHYDQKRNTSTNDCG